MNQECHFLLALVIIAAVFTLVMYTITLLILEGEQQPQPKLPPVQSYPKPIQLNSTEIIKEIEWCLTHD